MTAPAPRTGGVLHLFAYGILTRPDIVRAITGRDYVFRDAILPGYRRYGLPHPDGEVFAAIDAMAGHDARGRLLCDVSPADLARFDKVEEIGTGYYEHRHVHVQVIGDAASVSALAYVCGQARRHTLAGDWHPEAFDTQAADAFIRDVLPRLLA